MSLGQILQGMLTMLMRCWTLLTVVVLSGLGTGCSNSRIPPEQLGEVILDFPSLPGKDLPYEPKGLPVLSDEERMMNAM